MVQWLTMKKVFKTILKFPYCVYCGDYANSRDHYLTWSSTHAPYCVSCCVHCNAMLGVSGQDSLGHRAGYVAERLRDKHRIGLVTDWDRRLDGLEGNLRSAVESAWKETEKVRARISWAEAVYHSTGALLLESLHDDEEGLEILRDFLEALRSVTEETRLETP